MVGPPLPMAGVRVLEVASHVFVPVAGAVLAEWGADVLKVEHPVTGDPYRGLVTFGLHTTYQGVDVNFQYANRGKRSIGIDLTSDEGRALLDRFVERSDVFLTSLRPHAVKGLRIDVDDIRAVNPSIVYGRGTGQGVHGPDAERGGFDIAAYWSRSGMSDRLMSDGAEWPGLPPPAFGDLAAGVTLAGAVSTALYRRVTTGEPSVVDLSLLGMGMWQMQPDIVDAIIGGPDLAAPPSPDRNATRNPLVQHFRTSDDRFIALVMVDADRHWVDLCRTIGAPELADDPRFIDREARARNATECLAQLDAIFARRDFVSWCRVLRDATGVWAPVQTAAEVQFDPQVGANGYLGSAELGNGGSLPMVTSPVQFDGAAPTPLRAPEHGEHTESALLDLGLSWDEIAVLKEQGAVL